MSLQDNGPGAERVTVNRTLHNLPFFEARHQAVLDETLEWLSREPAIDDLEEGDHNLRSVQFAASAGRQGLLRHLVPPVARTAERDLDVRAISLVREALAYRSGLADSAIVSQGLCAVPIWQFGTQRQKEAYLPRLRDGTLLGALAISEPDGGSDVAATKTTATREGDCFVLNGDKTWTSNAGVAGFYLVIARTGEAPGAKGLSAFLVDARTAGLTVGKPIVVTEPHPMASIQLIGCKVSSDQLLGSAGEGFRIVMSTLDVFRSTVGAAALGLARRAYDEAVHRVRRRTLFGQLMSEMQTVQMKIAEMYVDLEAATTVVYRAAWARDHAAPGQRTTAEASLAKLFATEASFRIIDSAVQLFGGAGVTRGNIIERLYREIRPMRIYEGASEVQKLILGRHALRAN
jgi:acyl-CoA dehydrogenase